MNPHTANLNAPTSLGVTSTHQTQASEKPSSSHASPFFSGSTPHQRTRWFLRIPSGYLADQSIAIGGVVTNDLALALSFASQDAAIDRSAMLRPVFPDVVAVSRQLPFPAPVARGGQ